MSFSEKIFLEVSSGSPLIYRPESAIIDNIALAKFEIARIPIYTDFGLKHTYGIWGCSNKNEEETENHDFSILKH